MGQRFDQPDFLCNTISTTGKLLTANFASTASPAKLAFMATIPGSVGAAGVNRPSIEPVV